MTFGHYLKQLRRERGLTQRLLAAQAGVNFTYISKLENDRLEHTPSLKTLKDLARTLDVDELELMDRANKVPPLLDVIVKDQDALRFFRRATETIKDPKEWQELLHFLENREKSKSGAARSKLATSQESTSVDSVSVSTGEGKVG